MSPDRPNRFKLLLEREANPPQFPPPQVTPGLRLEEILPNEFPLLEQTLSEKNSAKQILSLFRRVGPQSCIAPGLDVLKKHKVPRK